MPTNLFSTYRGGENRVTSSILAVLQSLSMTRTERLLGALIEQAEFQLVRFQNQPSRGATGVPDAEIISSCRILVETKLVPKAVRADQLQRHLKRLDRSHETTQCLLVLTPDDNRPKELVQLSDPRLVWASFAALDQAISDLLNDETEVVSEREEFLLRELQAMLLAEELIGSFKDTVVVAARRAWRDYLDYSAYVCQPERPFQKVDYIAFYAAGEIHPRVAKVRQVFDKVAFNADGNKGPLKDLIRLMLAADRRDEGADYKVFLLSPPEDPDTVKLAAPVVNDLRSAGGRTIAFTQSQRYVTLEALKRAQHTSDLLAP